MIPETRPQVSDILDIQRTVLDFAYRDTGQWDRLAALFLPDATIRVAWYHGPIDGFIARSKAATDSGAPPARHHFATPRVDIQGHAATAETDVIITIRMPTPLGEADLTTWGRFHDLLRKQDGSWRIARRTAIYERDRLDPVAAAPGEGHGLDLSPYPAAIKHMAWVLSRVGRTLVPDIPMLGSALESEVLRDGRAWLSAG